MTKSVDQSEKAKAAAVPKGRILFVTDPLCSWCWGTLPEVLACREELKTLVEFDLIMGGLQIGPREGLLGYDVKRLRRLWQEVEETTGQRFSGKIPENFVYHSEISCRAVEIARQQSGGLPPFEFFAQLQKAFYHDGMDINHPEVLAKLLNQSEANVVDQLQSQEVIKRTRANFELAKALAATALPHLLIDVGQGYQLLCGGYIERGFLSAEIHDRLTRHTSI